MPVPRPSRRSLRPRQDLLDRHVLVVLAVRLAHGHQGVDLVDAGVDRALHPDRVRHQRAVRHVVVPLDALGDLVRVSQRRDRLRVGEGSDLDPSTPVSESASMIRLSRRSGRTHRVAGTRHAGASRRGSRPRGTRSYHALRVELRKRLVVVRQALAVHRLVVRAELRTEVGDLPGVSEKRGTVFWTAPAPSWSSGTSTTASRAW